MRRVSRSLAVRRALRKAGWRESDAAVSDGGAAVGVRILCSLGTTVTRGTVPFVFTTPIHIRNARCKIQDTE